MNRKERNKAKKILRRNLIAGTLLLFLLGLSIAGATGAWFTSASTIQNLFTAGKLSIDVSNPSSDTTLSTDSCTELWYDIYNTGTKRLYTRAYFDGLWTRSYHRNIASATVEFNDEIITVSDVAYYSYGTYRPENGFNIENDFLGFHDMVKLPPVVFPPLTGVDECSLPTSKNRMFAGSVDESGKGYTINNITMTSYPTPCDGPKVVPINKDSNVVPNYDYYFGGSPGQGDPNIARMPRPEGCDLKFFKIERDEDQLVNGRYTIETQFTKGDNTGFEVAIYKSGGNQFFAFESNYPVMNVFVKGGAGGAGNLYFYYPTFEKGIYKDCGLSQPGGGWSHISFYYCVPEDKPGLEIKKEVSVDGGISWHDANELNGAPVIDPEHDPKFRITVTNIGNVILKNIVVTDDYFGDIGTINSLEPADYRTFERTDFNWKVNQLLDTNNVTLKLCSDGGPWKPAGDQPLGTYFYYNDIVHPSVPGQPKQPIPLCVKLCLNENLTTCEYHGAVFTLYSFFEAIQVTNGMVDINWPGSPIDVD